MSRLYDVYIEAPERFQPAPPEQAKQHTPLAEPLVYQGEFTGAVYLQRLREPYEPIVLGYTLAEVEDIRDRLTAFLDGAWRGL